MSAEEVADALVSYCKQGSVVDLQQLLSTYPDLDLNYVTEGGVTLLMHAIIGAGTDDNPSGLYLETCQLLVQYGVHLETADLTFGRTAAHWVTYYHRDDILTELIIAGSDMTCPDFSGISPFHLAIQEGALKCLAQCLRLLPKEILEIPDSQFRLPLHHAVQVGSIEACQLLIAAEADVNVVQEVTGLTPLHMAAELGQGTIIEYLLRQGALLDITDSNGLTAVHVASVCDSVEGGLGAIVRVVGGGGVLNLIDERGVTPLIQACAAGSEHNVKFLLKKKVEVLARDAVEGKTCLHWAAGSNTPTAASCLQLIIKKHRGLLEAKDNFGRTPLLSCANNGVVESLQVLIASGCDVESVDLDGRTAVHWATESGNYAVLSTLIESSCPIDTADNAGATPIHYAVQRTAEPTADGLDPDTYEQALNQCKNVQACAAILIEKGAKVNVADNQGMQPLHHAMQFPNNLQVCLALLTQGADPSAKDNLGMTAFHIAAQRGITENCQFLLEHTGGHLGNEVDGHGQTALHYAVVGGSVECLEYLLSCELPIDQSDDEMRTASHIAATVGHLECLQLLAAYGANFLLKSIHGALPMHEAAANGHTDALSYLIYTKSPVNDPAGESCATALHYAVAGGHEECVKILVDNGASVNAIATNDEGEQLTPMDYCPDECVDISELLESLGGVAGVNETKDNLRQRKDVVDKSGDVEEHEVGVAGDVEEQEVGVAGGVDEHEVGVAGDVEEHEVGVAEETDQPYMGVAEDTDQVLDIGVPETRVETPEPDSVSIRSIRPHTPVRPLQEKGPVFEIEQSLQTAQLEGVASPSRPSKSPPPSSPGKANILQRALSVLKREKKDDTILSSTVGLYAAHATMLAATMIGTPLGEKAVEISHKVATDSGEELKKTAASYEGQNLPDLIWLREEQVRTPTPSPTPPLREPISTPTLTPPPPVRIREDPYERRLRKAKAQLDQTKSPGYLAVEELLKAQSTHMKLTRQFQEDKLRDDLRYMREEFRRDEERAKQASEKVLKRLAERMKKAESLSEQMNKSIDAQLQEANQENAKLSSIMAEMGVSTRPTVSQWIQQKTNQKKEVLQDSLINWDRNKKERNTAILLQQTITSQRALRHAAWGAKKEISARIKALREIYDPVSVGPVLIPNTKSSASTKALEMSASARDRKLQVTTPTNSGRLRGSPHSSKVPAKSSPNRSVLATPSGFLSVRDTSPQEKEPKATLPAANEQVWYLGKDYIDGKYTSLRVPHPPSQTYIRATGPKSVHAERTLHFLSPEEYKAKRKERLVENQLTLLSNKLSKKGQRSKGKTAVSITSVEFDKKRAINWQPSSYSEPQYHSLASPPPPAHHTSSLNSFPILPMTVSDSNPSQKTVAT